MTLPTEGVNPWRAVHAPAHNAGTAPASLPAAAHLADTTAAGAIIADAQSLGAKDGGKEFKAFGDDGFTFWDFVDIINPLQHIPIVSAVYRDMTEDNLDPAPKVMGGTLFMGPIGLVSSLADVWVQHETGKDMGSHMMAMFKDDAAPLSGTATAAAGAPARPAAAGSDGVDPVTQWAREQAAFYRGETPATAAATEADAVTAWAAAQHAYYQDPEARARQAANGPATDPVTAWAASQQAFYRDAAAQIAKAGGAPEIAEAAPVAPAAAGTDGVDPVTQWARDQHAFYAKIAQANGEEPGGADPVSAWAARQNAFYRGGVEQPERQPRLKPDTQIAAAGADGADPVAAWAREQTAFYGARQGGTTVAAAPRPAPVKSAGLEPDAVMAWAQQQLAWVHGDRAKELALADLPAATAAAGARDDSQPGAVAGNGGWFRDNMLKGWAKYNAAQQLGNPTHRPDLAVVR